MATMYFPKSRAELEQVKTECLRLVNQRAVVSGVAAAIPLPGIDFTADVVIMAELLTEINRRFGLSEEQLQSMDPERLRVLLVIITSVGSEIAGKTVSTTTIRSLLRNMSSRIVAKSGGKYVPLVGQAVSAGISFAAMRYLGMHHVEQCYEIAWRYMSNVDQRYIGDIIDVTGGKPKEPLDW